jgi:Tol biopolymer transport system component
MVETHPGIVMGTSYYMSPEQARGLEVDARSDIWSLGVVLYEMLTGHVPFGGASSIDVALSIVQKEPPPISQFVKNIPESLELIVSKSLRKDKEERHQTAKELCADLRSLHHRLRYAAALDSSVPQELSSGANISTELVETSYHSSREEAAAQTGNTEGRQTGPGPAGAGLKIGSYKIIALALAAFIVIAGSALAVLKYTGSRRVVKTEPPFQQTRLSKLTTTGRTTRVAISPDGRYIVHALDEGGQQSLLVRQVAVATSTVQIVPPSDVVYRGLTFSPDGNYIYYVTQEKNNPIQVLYQVPLLKGDPRRILVNIDSPIGFSPDGNRFTFVRRYRDRGEDELIIAGADGTGEKVVVMRTGDEFFSIGGPAWSPDGKVIVTAAGSKAGGRSMGLVQIDVEGGRERPFSEGKWSDIGRVAWLADGSGLVAVATEQGSTLSQVWHISYPDGAVRKITSDLSDYRDIALTADARSLATVRIETRINVWVAPPGEAWQARQLTSGVGQDDGVKGLAWTPDGKIVYVSKASGSQDIWIMEENGAEPKQLTTPATRADVYPTVSPDGRYIVFTSNRQGNSNLWRIETDGSNPTQLTNGSGEEFPSFSPDGKWLVYTVTSSSRFSIWKVSVDGGTPAQLTDKLSQWPVVSPDGKLIACWYREESKSPWRIAILPFEGGAPLKTFDVSTTVGTSIPVRWSPDGRALNYIETSGGVSNIWTQPVDGGQPRQLTDFKSDQMLWFDWSRDGRQLAFARGAITSDVVLISDAK